MARNPRDVETSLRARLCASTRRAIGASMFACALAGMLSVAAPSAAAQPVQVPAVADDDPNTCKQVSGDMAIAACTRAIASGGAFNNRGLAYQDKHDYDRAIADFNEAIRLDPRDSGQYLNRGLANLYSGRCQKLWPTSTNRSSSIPNPPMLLCGATSWRGAAICRADLPRPRCRST